MLTVSGAMLDCKPALACVKGRAKCMKRSVAAAMLGEMMFRGDARLQRGDVDGGNRGNRRLAGRWRCSSSRPSRALGFVFALHRPPNFAHFSFGGPLLGLCALR